MKELLFSKTGHFGIKDSRVLLSIDTQYAWHAVSRQCHTKQSGLNTNSGSLFMKKFTFETNEIEKKS